MKLTAQVEAYTRRLQRLSEPRLVVESTLLALGLKFALIAVLVVPVVLLVPFSLPELLGPLRSDPTLTLYDHLLYLAFITILVPLPETFTGQFVPIWIAGRFTKRAVPPILFSAVLFSIFHGGISIIITFPVSVVFATIFYLKKESLLKAFYLTAIAHALFNLITGLLDISMNLAIF